MQIILDPTLVKVESNEQRKIWLSNQQKTAVENLQKNLSYKLDKIPGKQYNFVGTSIDINKCENLQEGFLKMLSQSYSRHEKIEIAPHDIWYLVLSEIAIIIKANTKKCRQLFTKSDEKIDIKVFVNDVTKIDLAAVVAQLSELIPVDVDMFVPTLSTTTPEALIAMYAALCDGVSAYYNYSTYCCGIPEVRLTGTREDWTTLLSCTAAIAALFVAVDLPKAVEYLIRVGDVLDKIQHSFDSIDQDFWKGIFTSKNIGSGGELQIDGWITDLYFEKRKLKKIENFMTSVTMVNYKNLDTGLEFKGVYGAFECIRTNDDFLRAGYSNLIYEVVDAPVPEKSRIILPNRA